MNSRIHKAIKSISIIGICFLITTKVIAYSPSNFSQTKKIANDIFRHHPVTLYCGCSYDPNSKEIDLNSCSMQSAENIKRAHRLEWEHMMPAENFGRQLVCWRERICKKADRSYSGRKCCESISAEFRQMEAELYNLWPSVGLVNQARSNYRYSQFSNIEFMQANFYGCPILIVKTLRKVEPRNEAKGIVARANLFMSEKYNIRLSASQRKLFETWNKIHPPTEWEKQWANKIATIEGYANSYIENY